MATPISNTTFWDKYKVFIFGLVGSILFALQGLLDNNTQETDIKIYAYAALMAGLSFIATQWRGKVGTITGVIGTLAGMFVTLQQTGSFTWFQFIISGILSVLAAFTPPPKPSSYEHNEAIVAAKEVPPVAPTVDDSKLPLGGSGTDIKNNP